VSGMGKRSKPPLDDPRWRGMMEVIDLRRQQNIGLIDAVTDLEQAMATGKLRSMRRNVSTGAREQIDDLFWIDHRIDVVCDYGSVVVYRLSGESSGNRQWDVFDHSPHERVEGHAYYVWQPDLDELYATSARPHQDGSNTPMPVKPGPKPTGDWPMVLARWLIAVALDDAQRLRRPNLNALAAEAEVILRNRIGWAPEDIKVLRAKIRELLPDVRS
jgi:hypothetical protein